jgi:hypothetical protein
LFSHEGTRWKHMLKKKKVQKKWFSTNSIHNKLQCMGGA